MDQDCRGRLPGSCSNYKKRRFGRSKKRKHIFNVKKDTDENKISASSKKLQDVNVEGSDVKNRILDIDILFKGLENFVACSKCKGKLKFSESNFRGLDFKIEVKCFHCNEKVIINSSKQIGQRGNAPEVNRRSVLAARALGHGHAGLSTFCGIMDLPQPVAHAAYDKINKHLRQATEKVAQESMTAAVKEEIAETPNDNPGLVVSGDGSWRKRGFTSLQGVVSLVGNWTKKVLDISIKNSFCRQCTAWEGKEETAEYQEWYEDHKTVCPVNHEGTSGKMEVDGILEIFLRSEEKYQIKYHQYIGDGDSSVYRTLSHSKPYGDTLLVEKKECIGHVQKRMGTRLRELKKKLAGKLLADGKSIGGKGRLTSKVIDQLTKYYGNAIRSHSESVEEMSDAIWATYYHKRSTDTNPEHHLCPKGLNSWCAWQKCKAQKTHRKFLHTSSLPSAIMDQLKTIYEDLSKPELLERCLGGFTQNTNESFNNSVWKLVPKTSFSGMTVLEIGAFIAVSCFNDGRAGFLKVMKEFNTQPGHSAVQWVKCSDDSRLFHAERKATAGTREARQARIASTTDNYYSAGAH